jgi:hypothetical protein
MKPLCREGHDMSITRYRSKGGRTYCSECKKQRNSEYLTPERRRDIMRRWRALHPDRAKSAARSRYLSRLKEYHAYHLKATYGITPEQYDEMLSAQGGTCAICAAPPRPSRRLAVDHDHQTGKIRGLLCGLCNVSLGRYERFGAEGFNAYLERAR